MLKWSTLMCLPLLFEAKPSRLGPAGRYSKICHLFSAISIHSFKNFYSASSSPLLLRGAPISSTFKKNSFKTTIECVYQSVHDYMEWIGHIPDGAIALLVRLEMSFVVYSINIRFNCDNMQDKPPS